MGIEAREVQHGGIVLVSSVTGQPAPMSVRTFSDLDEAEAFIQWCGGRPKWDEVELERQLDQWDREKRQCDVCCLWGWGESAAPRACHSWLCDACADDEPDDA